MLLSLPLCVTVSLVGIVWPETLASWLGTLNHQVLPHLDGFFLLSVSAFWILLLWIGLSRFGRIRLGSQEDRPTFSTPSWLAMLFAAGMGVGLMFWGAAEPLIHFSKPPYGSALDAAAAQRALVLACFHWGFHAWGVYGLVALALAYFGFRKGLPYLPSAAIRVMFGGRWAKRFGSFADVTAIVAVVFGVAGSIGIAVLQINAGLTHVSSAAPKSVPLSIAVLVVVVLAYMLSASTRIEQGIKWLSNINMVLALFVLSFVLITGPTSDLLRTFVDTFAAYAARVTFMPAIVYAKTQQEAWVHGWTVNLFNWWVAWAPFVGVFVARISKGRTIRQFVLGVLIAPTIFTVLWFSVLGGTAFHQEMQGAAEMSQLVHTDVTGTLFALLGQLPWSLLLSIVAIVLMFVFVVTSADSATFVLGMLSSEGSMNPPLFSRLAWGIGLAVLGSALVLSGSVDVVREVSVLGAGPFVVVMIVQAVALLKALRQEA